MAGIMPVPNKAWSPHRHGAAAPTEAERIQFLKNRLEDTRYKLSSTRFVLGILIVLDLIRWAAFAVDLLAG